MSTRHYDGRKNITAKTGKRLRRLALELEGLANRILDEGWAENADVRRAAHYVDSAGREVCRRIEAKG